MAEEFCAATIDANAHTVIIGVPAGTDVTALVPTITLSDYATVLPLTDVAQDFTNPVTYVVTSESGLVQNWVVTVKVLPQIACPANMIVGIDSVVAFEEYSPVGGVFTGTGVSGDSFDATSLARDNYDITYKYTDVETGCELTCTFTVTVASNENDITAFTMTEEFCSATIDADAHTIIIGVPAGTDVTALVPVIIISDYATVLPMTDVAQDFTSPVTYVVTSESGLVQNWIVTVKVLPQMVCPENMNVTTGSTTAFEGYSPVGGVFTGQGVSGISFDATGLSNGNYNVTYTYTDVETGCELSCIFTVNVSSVGIKSAAIKDLTIYPNPNSGRFFIDFGTIEGEVSYQISDVKGSILSSEKIFIPNGGLKELSLNLVPGVYFIRIINEQNSYIEKFIVE